MSADQRPRVLTFGYGEQVAEVGASLLRWRRLEAPDLPQHELVVGGQARQADEVVAKLALQGGAGHAAVQHLWRGDRGSGGVIVLTSVEGCFSSA